MRLLPRNTAHEKVWPNACSATQDNRGQTVSSPSRWAVGGRRGGEQPLKRLILTGWQGLAGVARVNKHASPTWLRHLLYRIQTHLRSHA
jgi:hypothetical protein